MGVISVRLSDDLEASIRRSGANPGQIAKEALEAYARRAAAQEWLEKLDALRKPADMSVAEALRLAREELDARGR